MKRATNIADRGGDAGGERAVADIDKGDLQRPIAQRRVIGQVVGARRQAHRTASAEKRGCGKRARAQPRQHGENDDADRITPDKTRSPAPRARQAPKCRQAPADRATAPWWSATPRRSCRTRSGRGHRLPHSSSGALPGNLPTLDRLRSAGSPGSQRPGKSSAAAAAGLQFSGAVQATGCDHEGY